MSTIKSTRSLNDRSIGNLLVLLRISTVFTNSPYAGGASPGGLEGCKLSKHPSFLHQARATPAPGGEKGSLGRQRLPVVTSRLRDIGGSGWPWRSAPFRAARIALA